MRFHEEPASATTHLEARDDRGLFVTFEGIDGAGKSTHIARLTERFKQEGREVVLSREPGGTELAERLRELVLHQPMSSLTETMLVFAARRDHIERVILPALQRDAVVLCDRFTDSSWAYQGGGRGFDHRVLRQLEGWVQQGLQPDLTVWFDLPPQIAAQRRAAVRAADRFEEQDIAFFEAVRGGYAQRADRDQARFLRINANQPVEDVWIQLSQGVDEKLQALSDAHMRTRSARP